MKVLHAVTSDIGGAARATIRINNSINFVCKYNKGKVIVIKKNTSNSSVEPIAVNKLKKILAFRNRIFNDFTISKYNNKTLFSHEIMGFDLLKEKHIREFNIVNLHWINGGMLSYNTLKKLKYLNKPIVWTLHDMWPFTGGCHYDEECGRFKEDCGKCKVLRSSKEVDLSTKIQEKKKKIYDDLNITVVGCSSWITECAKQSKLFKDKKCINIANPIDIDMFKPIDKEICKGILNINTNKKIILFGAMSSTSDERKGFKFLLEAIKKLDSSKYIALIFGNNSEESEVEEHMEVRYLGNLVDDYTLTLVYNAADVFVAPSIQENLANTVLESLSCGTPVVAFDIGGMKDMIKNEYNGYLAEPFDSIDLSKGIDYCINNNDELSFNARSYVVDNFTYEIIGNKYIDLYNDLLKADKVR